MWAPTTLFFLNFNISTLTGCNTILVNYILIQYKLYLGLCNHLSPNKEAQFCSVGSVSLVSVCDLGETLHEQRSQKNQMNLRFLDRGWYRQRAFRPCHLKVPKGSVCVSAFICKVCVCHSVSSIAFQIFFHIRKTTLF